jgi:hypothetical protein
MGEILRCAQDDTKVETENTLIEKRYAEDTNFGD